MYSFSTANLQVKSRGSKKLWIYDLRTNQHFTLKERTLKRSDLDEFVQCFHAENRHERKEGDRFKASPTKTCSSETK
jgi:type I restriction enzyme M protein